jgi:hypothetical protein
MGLPHRLAEALVHLKELEPGPRALAPVGRTELDSRAQLGQDPMGRWIATGTLAE